MRLWKEIFEQLGGEPSSGVTGLLYTVWEGKGGYFQNVKNLSGFSPQEIVLTLRRGTVKITGKELTVEKYCENDVFIKGNILSVEREGV